MNKLQELPNIIGDSLGRGLAKDIFRKIRTIEAKLSSAAFPAVDWVTLRERKRTCEKFQAYYRPLMIDAIAARDYSRYSVLTLRSKQMQDGRDLLFAYNEVWDFHSLIWPSADGLPRQMRCDGGTVAAISQHAVQRCVQRAKVRTIKDVIEVLGAASNWTGVSNALQHHGPFMIPAEQGMVCCDTVMPLSAQHESTLRGTLVKTFVGLDAMTEAMRRRWERLTAAASGVDQPRCVREFLDPEKFRDAFELMADEGQRWLEWRAKAGRPDMTS